jgi:putative ABC transport system ATP-binding protein
MVDVNTEDIISGSTLFARLDDAGRKKLGALAEREQVEAGTVLCREGDPGDAVFIVMQGTVTVSTTNLSGEEEVMTELGTGAVVGEIGVVSQEPRSATVKAETDCWIMRLDREGVMAILEDYPEILADLRRLGLQRAEDTLSKLLTTDVPTED